MVQLSAPASSNKLVRVRYLASWSHIHIYMISDDTPGETTLEAQMSLIKEIEQEEYAEKVPKCVNLSLVHHGAPGEVYRERVGTLRRPAASRESLCERGGSTPCGPVEQSSGT